MRQIRALTAGELFGSIGAEGTAAPGCGLPTKISSVAGLALGSFCATGEAPGGNG